MCRLNSASISFSFLLLCALLLWSGTVLGAEAPAAEDEEAALFAELDALLRDPLEDAAPRAEAATPRRIWQTTAATGVRFGYTTNALLSKEALAMPYITARMDATVVAFEEARSLTFMISGENRRFLGEAAPDDERLALALARVEKEVPLVDLGAEAGALHAKQAFDAAAAVPQVPDAGFVTQTLPFARVWVRHYPFPRTALEWSLRGDRAFFGDSADDFASATARLRLSHSLWPGVLIHVAGERTESRYERRSLRLDNGFPVADSRLRLETWRAEAELEVRAGERLPFRAAVRAYAEDRDDTMRGYYARASRGVEARAVVRRGGWRATLHGRYEDSPFSTRRVSPVSVDTVTQRRRGGSVSLERSLGRWRIAGQAQRIRFLSNAAFESYTVNQYELSADFYF